MGKTKRIKNVSNYPKWVTHDYINILEGVPWGWQWCYVPKTEKDLARSIAKFHADKKAGRRNAPKWFRKSLDKIKRAKDKAELTKINKTGVYDDYSFTPRHKDMNWEWW
jgi:hypothetical protein